MVSTFNYPVQYLHWYWMQSDADCGFGLGVGFYIAAYEAPSGILMAVCAVALTHPSKCISKAGVRCRTLVARHNVDVVR